MQEQLSIAATNKVISRDKYPRKTEKWCVTLALTASYCQWFWYIIFQKSPKGMAKAEFIREAIVSIENLTLLTNLRFVNKRWVVYNSL